MSWSAAQYVKFEDERHPAGARSRRTEFRTVWSAARPTSAAVLAIRPRSCARDFRTRRSSASNSSPDMIAAARKRLPGIAFEVADIRRWRLEQRFDVILANAVLQWIPGHETLMPALIERLNPGGALAVQTPDNLDEPSHRLMREIAGAGPWAAKLKAAAKARAARHDAGWYFRLLRAHASHVDIWRTTYHHPLAGAHAVVEWVKGAGLRPFIDPLDESEREAYLARYEAAIAKAYPAEADGTVLLPFPRLFFVATR